MAYEGDYPELRARVREVCSRFPDEYWRRLDQRREYPEEFVREMTESGLLAALIPEEYGLSHIHISEPTRPY